MLQQQPASPEENVSQPGVPIAQPAAIPERYAVEGEPTFRREAPIFLALFLLAGVLICISLYQLWRGQRKPN